MPTEREVARRVAPLLAAALLRIEAEDRAADGRGSEVDQRSRDVGVRSRDRDRRSERTAAVRWPVAPLLAEAGGSVAELALRAGVARRTVNRWAHAGLTDAMADRAACGLGTHPALVWPDWHDSAPASASEEVPVPCSR